MRRIRLGQCELPAEPCLLGNAHVKVGFSGRPVILFDRLAGIGDIICTFPSVLELRKRHPDAIFVYSTWKSFKSVVEMGRVADLVVKWEQSWMPRLVDKYYYPRLEDERPPGQQFAHLVDDFAQTFGR